MALSGFNHKMHILLKKTIEKLLTYKIDPRRFEILKEEVCNYNLNSKIKMLKF